MAITVSVEGRNAGLEGLAARIDQGSSNSTIVFYDGTVPTNVTTALSGNNTIATSVMASTAFGAASSASISANAIPQVTVSASGTISFFRIFDGDNVAIMQGTAGDTGSEDCVIDESTVVSGGDFNVTALAITQAIG